MSGIEVAGLAFGIVPILVEILKSYSTAKRRLITFSRHSEVVCDIQLRFQVAAASFNNDCRLLLQAAAAYPGDISAMMKDPMHQGWKDQEMQVEERLQSLMQHDYDLCRKVVTRLRDILRETQASLVKLESVLEVTGQSHHAMTRRIWHAFNTARKENDYMRQLDSLEKWNKMLSQLQKQRCKIQKRRDVASPCIVRKAAPGSYRQIRVASQQLRESLHDSWSCTNTYHMGHQARLSLDAKSGHGEVRLDIVVACQPKPDQLFQRSAHDLPNWLQIRSLSSVTKLIPPISNPSPLANSLSSSFERKVTNFAESSKSMTLAPKRRAPFNQTTDVGCSRLPRLANAETIHAHSFVMLDLKSIDSVCCHMSSVRSSKSICQDGCVGYLEISKDVPITRLIFYDASKLASGDRALFYTSQEASPIRDLIPNLRVLQQITLAHKLAEAVLQYHSTSWLPQAWTLEDVSYFKNTSQSTTDHMFDELKSLHLSSRISDHDSLAAESKEQYSSLKHTYGIRNLTLARLGVALLEVGGQENITRASLDHTPYEIIDARRLLDEGHHSLMTLGPRYLEIVRKCIHCDFSCNDDLNSEALRSAVYTEVICALQDMRSRWERWFAI